MGRVEVKPGLSVDGRPVFLRAGEIHYFRLPKDQWADRLDKAVAAHLNTITTYMPWFWHEPSEGEFDFTGRTLPERDLVAFMDMVAERGLYLVARPGPFLGSELTYGGHPDWLFTRYPEVCSHTAQGERAFWVGNGVPCPSQLHPTFLELAGRWYDQIGPILQPYSIENGGPIILWQPDNEMNLAFTYGFDGSQYDAHILGTGTEPGLWQQWLAETYGDLDTLSRRYETPFRALADVQPPRTVAPGAGERRLALDWLRFKQWVIFRYAHTLMEKMAPYLPGIPVTLNEPVNHVWGSGDHAQCVRYFQKAGVPVLTTGHTYLYGGEQDALGLPVTIYRLEMVKTQGPAPAISVEMGVGWFDLSRNRAAYNWDLLQKALVGHGLDGYSHYMYAGGYNAPGTGRYGRYYWNAPVLPDGSEGPGFKPCAELARFLRDWEQELAGTVKVPDLHLAIFSELPLVSKFLETGAEVRVYSDSMHGSSKQVKGPFSAVYSSILESLTVLTALGLNVEFVNLSHAGKPPGPHLGPLVVPNPGELPPEGFTYVEQHLAAGGTVLFYPVVPTRDTDGNQRPELARALGVQQLGFLPPPGFAWNDTKCRWVDAPDFTEVAVDGPLATFAPPEGAQTLITYRGQACAYRQEALGGTAVVLGVVPSYQNADSQRLFDWLLTGAAGAGRNAHSADGILHVVQRRRSDGTGPVLVTTGNYLGEESQTRLTVECPWGALTFPRLSDLAIPPKHVRFLWLGLDLGQGRRLEYCTSELTRTNEAGCFLAEGANGTPGEVALNQPALVTYAGQAVLLEQHGPMWIGRYEHGRSPDRLSIRF